MSERSRPEIVAASYEAFNREGAEAVLQGDLVASVRSFFTWKEAIEAAGIESLGIESPAG